MDGQPERAGVRGFFLAWTAEIRNLSQLVREIDGEHLPRVAAEIPWGHNMVLIFKLKDPIQRLWYAHQATANGWSRSMLEHWIESDVYSRQGKAVTNFSSALPPPQSDLAKEIVRASHRAPFTIPVIPEPVLAYLLQTCHLHPIHNVLKHANSVPSLTHYSVLYPD